MNDSLASTLVLCDLDNLLLGEDGNLTQVVRDVLQLFSSRGGRLTVFSQRSPRAVRSILGSVRLAAPALVCGGTMAYHYADGNRVPLCSFAQQQELFTCLPDTPGVGVAVQMQDGTTRVLRMSNALERHLRQEWTPYLLANAADIHPEQVLRVLLYQDSKSVPLISLAEKAIGDRVALLGEDGNLTQVVRDVLQLFSSRGGRLTVFSQRSPRAVRSILGSVRLAAPALVCGGTMAYHYADGNRVPLCSFAQQQELFACLPDTPGVGVAVQMQDGTTRVLRMSNALERHLRQEWTPYLLANAADIHPEQVLRVLLYQDSKSVPLISLAEKAIGDRVALLGERIAPDTLVLTPKRISGREMLDTVCAMAQVGAEQVLALAGGQPMLELVQAVEHSAVAADAPAELRLAAEQITLTDAAGGAAVEVLYRMVRAAEKSV